MGGAAAWLGAYLGAVLWLTWPLAAHLTTHLPRTHLICDFDQRQMIWALAWTSHRLVTDPLHLFDANIYHPLPHTLLYAEAGFGALPFFLPTYLATGDATLAANVMFLGSLALTAWGLHLLVAHWTGRAGAGVVAATTFLLTPWTLWTWAPGALNYAVLQWAPLVVWLAASESPSRRRTIALGLVLAAQGATSPYVAAGMLAPVGVLAVARLARARTRASGVALLGALGLAVGLLLVVYGGYAWVRWREPTMAANTWWPGGFFKEFAFPADLFFARHRPNAIPLAMFVLIAAGAVCAIVRRRARATPWRQGLLWTVVGMCVSLPPTLVLFGWRTTLPHVALLQHTPLFDLMREPQRLAVGALFGLAILAGAAFAEIAGVLGRLRLRPALAEAALAAVVLVGAQFTYVNSVWPPADFGIRLLPFWYPIAPTGFPGPAIVDELRRRDGTLLELPAEGSWQIPTVTANAQAMFESTAHWRPLVNGYGGYYPGGFRETLALAGRLPDADALDQLRRRTDLALILVRGDAASPEQRAAFEALADAHGGPDLRLLVRDGTDLLFAVGEPRG
jgi:hypothetical protein